MQPWSDEPGTPTAGPLLSSSCRPMHCRSRGLCSPARRSSTLRDLQRCRWLKPPDNAPCRGPPLAGLPLRIERKEKRRREKMGCAEEIWVWWSSKWSCVGSTIGKRVEIDRWTEKLQSTIELASRKLLVYVLITCVSGSLPNNLFQKWIKMRNFNIPSSIYSVWNSGDIHILATIC